MSRFILNPLKDQGTIIGLLSEKGSLFYHNLFQLLKFYHKKIILIHCSFDRIVYHEDQPGLWHYLQSSIQEIPIQKKDGYDVIAAGHYMKHGAELIASSNFYELLQQLVKSYDFIFLLSRSSLSSQEAIEIFNHCDRTIIATSNESYDVLAPYIKKAKEDTHSCGFTQYGVFPE